MSAQNQNPHLLVIGELNMDLILNGTPSFPELGKEKIADDFDLTLGSSSAIFAGNIARLGVTTGFCGMVGKDSFGETIIDSLQDFSIDTSNITVSPNHKTGLTAIIRHNNDRAMVTYPGAMEHFSLKDIPGQAFVGKQHLHISSLFLQPNIQKDLFEIIGKAKDHGLTISIDPQWDPQEEWKLDFKKLVGRIDFFLPNENEFLNIAEAETISEAIQKFQPHLSDGAIIIKQGTKGATCVTAQKVRQVSGYLNEDPVDTVGAGDSFNAGFIYRFLQGDAIDRCIQFGNITGAVSTTASGGTAAIQSLDEVFNIAQNNLSITDLDDFTR